MSHDNQTQRGTAHVHPGEHLAEFLEEYGLTAYRVAKATRMSQDRLSHILRGKRAITADTALRLGYYFGTTPEFWLNLQNHYDLETAQAALAERLEHEVEPLQAV